MPDPNRFRDDPLLRLPGLATLAAARAAELQLMDEYGREIFDLWFSGKAPAEVVLDSRKWAAYMQAADRLHERWESAGGARHGPPARDRRSIRAGRRTGARAAPVDDRESGAGPPRRRGGSARRLRHQPPAGGGASHAA